MFLLRAIVLVLLELSWKDSEEGDSEADFLKGLSPLTTGNISYSCQAQGVHVATPRFCLGCLKPGGQVPNKTALLRKGSLGGITVVQPLIHRVFARRM